MPVPTLITELSTTAASNSPPGSDSPATIDDYLRANAAFIAQLRDGKPDTANVLLKAGGSMTGLLGFKKGADITAAATTDLGTATGNTVDVTHTSGTVATTSLGGASLQAGTEIETRYVISGGTLTLTHHATNLYLAGGADITLANGDVIRWRKMHSSNAEWKMVGGVKADGTAWAVAPVANTVFGSSVNLTGTYVDITGISSSYNEIVLHVASLSTNGSSLPLLLLGDSGGFETSGYIGSNSLPYAGPNWLGNVFSNSFELSPSIAAASVFSGMIVLRRLGGTYWSISWQLATSNSAAVSSGAGYKQLSDSLTQLRFIMANATDTFDSGSVTPTYRT